MPYKPSIPHPTRWAEASKLALGLALHLEEDTHQAVADNNRAEALESAAQCFEVSAIAYHLARIADEFYGASPDDTPEEAIAMDACSDTRECAIDTYLSADRAGSACWREWGYNGSQIKDSVIRAGETTTDLDGERECRAAADTFRKLA